MFKAFAKDLKRRAISRFTRNEEGVASIEFAFLGTAFFAALLGVMEMGRIAFTAAALHYAAEEGTRYAIVRMGTATTEMISDYAGARLKGVVDSEAAVITTTAPINNLSGSKIISVRVVMEYRPWFDLFVPSFTLVGESEGFLAFEHSV